MHGTNKPWGVGMRVRHGCIRMYPEGIEKLYDLVEEGDKVEIVEQNVKAGWQGGVLFLEVHTMHEYGLEEEEIAKAPGQSQSMEFRPKAEMLGQMIQADSMAFSPEMMMGGMM